MRTGFVREGDSPAATLGSPITVCPNCGGEMQRSSGGRPTLMCGACREVQRVDALSPAVAKRQQEHLHNRGIDRLRNALGVL